MCALSSLSHSLLIPRDVHESGDPLKIFFCFYKNRSGCVLLASFPPSQTFFPSYRPQSTIFSLAITIEFFSTLTCEFGEGGGFVIILLINFMPPPHIYTATENHINLFKMKLFHLNS